MKKFILILLLILTASGLSAQVNLWISTDNLTVAGAVAADIMTSIHAQLGISSYYYRVQWQKSESMPEWDGLWIDFGNRNGYPRVFDDIIVFYSYDWGYEMLDYERSTYALYDLLNTMSYWTGKIQMIDQDSWSSIPFIRVSYTMNGNVYTVRIHFTPAG